MKTIIQLEAEETARLVSGEDFTLTLANGQSITLQAPPAGNGQVSSVIPVKTGIQRAARRGHRAQTTPKYSCDQCGEKFANRYAKGGHMRGCKNRRANGEKPANAIQTTPCRKCGQVYTKAAWLHNHEERCMVGVVA